MHARSNGVCVFNFKTRNFDVVHQLRIIISDNKGILVIINKYFGNYSLCSIVIPYAQELSLSPDPAGK